MFCICESSKTLTFPNSSLLFSFDKFLKILFLSSAVFKVTLAGLVFYGAFVLNMTTDFTAASSKIVSVRYLTNSLSFLSLLLRLLPPQTHELLNDRKPFVSSFSSEGPSFFTFSGIFLRSVETVSHGSSESLLYFTNFF